jgi:hypothetical protein
MSGTNALTVESVEQDHPHWQLWQSDSGLYWAALRKNLTPQQERHGCIPHLSAQSLEELAELLGDQARLGGRFEGATE